MAEKVINLYQTSQENLLKTSVLLLNKCYEEKLRTAVRTKDEANSILLDNLLWSFSQKSFIPHALHNDPLQSEHPIIITHENVENFSFVSFETLMLVQSFKHVPDCQRLIICFSQDAKQEALNLRHSIKHDKSNYYIQNDNGGWTNA